MKNNFKWVAEYDTDSPVGYIAIVAWTAALLSTIFPYHVHIWQICFWVIVPVVWVIIGLLFLTNEDRNNKRNIRYQALKNYNTLPSEVRAELPAINMEDLMSFSEPEVRDYCVALSKVMDEYRRQEELLNRPKVQAHMDEVGLVLARYRDSNRELQNIQNSSLTGACVASQGVLDSSHQGSTGSRQRRVRPVIAGTRESTPSGFDRRSV